MPLINRAIILILKSLTICGATGCHDTDIMMLRYNTGNPEDEQ